jgi:hypothetical protein
MLGPALQHSQRRALANLPFLGLGGRWQRQTQDAAPGRHNAPPTPWPASRWVNWPERAVAPPATHTAEMAQQTGPNRPEHSLAEPDPRDLQTLASLAPALSWAARRAVAQTRIQGDAHSVPAPSSPVWSSSGRLNPALVGILGLAHAQPATTVSTRSDFASQPGPSWQAAAEFLGAAAGSAVPLTQQSPGQAAGSLAPGQPAAGATYDPDAPARASANRAPSSLETLPHPVVTPAWSLLNVLPGIISRAVPPGRAGTAAQALTPREASVLGLPANEATGRRLPGREPGPYAPTPLQGLTSVTSAIEHLVERRVTSEVKRQREEMESLTRRREREEKKHPTLDVTSDEIVRVLLKKMQALSQQERFRLGRLR